MGNREGGGHHTRNCRSDTVWCTQQCCQTPKRRKESENEEKPKPGNCTLVSGKEPRRGEWNTKRSCAEVSNIVAKAAAMATKTKAAELGLGREPLSSF